MKPAIKIDTQGFKPVKSYSVEEIFAAGGTTAFAIKMGNTPEAMIKALENAPKEPATIEELQDLMAQLARDK